MSEPAPLTETGKFRMKLNQELGLDPATTWEGIHQRVRSLVYTIRQIRLTDADVLRLLESIGGSNNKIKRLITERKDVIENELKE